MKVIPYVIPGGMTSISQSLDVCINKPSKTMLKVEINVIGAWIKEAWDDIPQEMLAYSFKKW